MLISDIGVHDSESYFPAEQCNSAIFFGFILVGKYFVCPVLMRGFSNSIAQEFPLLKIKNMRLIEILVVLLYVASGMMFLSSSFIWDNSVVPSFLNTLMIQGLIVLLPNALSALLIFETVLRIRHDEH